MTPEQIKQAEEALINADPILGAVIKKQTLKPLSARADYFASLCKSIVGQQVSVAAARAIYGRLEAATIMIPSNVAALTEEQVKEIGLSKQKTAYIKDLAQHFVEDPDIYNHLDKLSDEEIIKDLTEVKGIGVWTAQMFLMFTLQRMDVFAPDDVGLQKGIIKLYGLETLPPKQDLINMTEKWSPYRTVASFHLWDSLDNKPA